MRRVVPLRVLCLGNPLVGDDGLGPLVAGELDVLAARGELPEGVEVIEGGTLGLSLLPFVEDAERVLFIDAVDVGDAPGALVRMERGDMELGPSRYATAHDVGAPDLLGLCRLRGTLPEEVVLLGLQVERLSAGIGLSPAVERAVPGLVQAVRDELRRMLTGGR